MVWLSVFHGTEEAFWRTLTPRRMDLLLTAYAGPAKKPQQRSLSEYLTTGGG